MVLLTALIEFLTLKYGLFFIILILLDTSGLNSKCSIIQVFSEKLFLLVGFDM